MKAKSVIEKTFEMIDLPSIGKHYLDFQLVYVQASGVRLKLQKFSTDDYYLDFDKKYFIAKDSKGNVLNCKIV